jgi:hypothetical protein
LSVQLVGVLLMHGLIEVPSGREPSGLPAEFFVLTDAGRAKAQELAERLQEPRTAPTIEQSTYLSQQAATHLVNAQAFAAGDDQSIHDANTALTVIAHAMLAIAATLQAAQPRLAPQMVELPAQNGGRAIISPDCVETVEQNGATTLIVMTSGEIHSVPLAADETQRLLRRPVTRYEAPEPDEGGEHGE